MESININNNLYYLCADLFRYHKTIFSGYKGRDVIKKQKLKQENYIYAYQSKAGWRLSTEDCRQAKVLINLNWYNLKFGSNNISLIESTTNNNININTNNLTSSSDRNINIYPILPNILDIEENEKFKDSSGNIINITIRGERNYKNCYFRVKDISKEFNMPNIQKVIINTETIYELNKHYKIFVIINRNNVSIDDNEKELYLTYKGVLKLLFSSRSGNAESFQDWAVEILFTVQLGTDESKYELVKSIFGGASVHAVKEAFKTSSGKTPCVYLFVIGNANTLLKTDKYSSDTLLYKFGQTDDLPRRAGEHERMFKKLFKIDHIELMVFSVIDPKYIVDAENSLKDFFKLNQVDFENTRELLALTKIDYDKATKHYKLIKNTYIGCYMEMQDKINKLERHLKDLQNEYDLTKEKIGNEYDLTKEKMYNELKLKDKDFELQSEKLHSELKLKDKELEIMNLKYKMLEEQLNRLSKK